MDAPMKVKRVVPEHGLKLEMSLTEHSRNTAIKSFE
jgi:hypothetical protein